MVRKPFGVTRHCLLALAISALAFSVALSRQNLGKVDFRRDVQPILKQFCIDCHGPSLQMNGFRLDRRRDAMRGGTISVIAPGNSQASRFYLKLIGSQYGPQMPPTGALRPEQIATLKAWIDQGAEWPDEASGEVAGLAAENHPPDEATDAMARFVKGQQYPDGGWRIFAHRLPIESSDIEVTAVSLRSLQIYGPQSAT